MADAPIPFGRAMRAAHFSYATSYTPLNHGSYGSSPRIVRAYQRQLQEDAESRPDPFIRRTLPRLLDESRAAIAPLLGVPVHEVVFVPNATTGINTVLRNLIYQKGDVILYFSTIYPAICKTIEYICETTLAENLCVNVDYPLEDNETLSRFHDAVSGVTEQGQKVKIALFDAVSTFPGVKTPWEALVKACSEKNIMSLIDGAHGVGHIDLTHLGKVEPDFFTSNCYKWLYTPRGCAVFHVPAHNQHLIRSSLPTAHGFQPLPKKTDPRTPPAYNPKRFAELFAFVATSDTTPYMCVPKALEFRKTICGGEQKIREYCKYIAQAGGKIIAEILGTGLMSSESGTLQDCCFVNVRLPFVFSAQVSSTTEDTNIPHRKVFEPKDSLAISKWMMGQFIGKYDTHIPVAYHGGAMWARLSGQIYLELKDFEFAGEALQDLCERVEKGEHDQSGGPKRSR